MQGTTVINPQANSRNIDRQVLLAEKVFLYAAVVITSIGFFVWGRSAAAQFTDITLVQNITGVVAAVLSAYVTDFAFRNFLEEVVYQGLAAFHPNVTGRAEKSIYFKILDVTRWVVLTIVVAALFYADWNSVQTIRDPFAASAKQRETTDIAAASATLSANLSSASAPMAQQIAALRADIAATEKRVTAGNTSLTALIHNNNGWAARELAKKKASATKSSRKELEKLQSAYTKTLSDQSATLTSTTNAISDQNTEITRENTQQKQSISAMYFMFGAGCKALTVLLRIFLVVSFLAKTPTLDANGDGIIDGRDVSAAARGGDGSFR